MKKKLYALVFLAAAAASFAAAMTAVPTCAAAAGSCFPIDECNICCQLPNGKLVCTQRACN